MWDERYLRTEYIYGTVPNRFFRSVLDTLPPGQILIPAAGEGRDAVYAATKGWKVTAYDQSMAARDKAIRLAAGQGVNLEYIVTDAVDFNSAIEEYDAIGLIFFHMPPDLRSTIHRKLSKHLKPGGTLIIQAFNPLQLKNTSGGPKDPEWLFTQEMLEDDFINLDILKNELTKEVLDEGSFHHGPADLISFIATRP